MALLAPPPCPPVVGVGDNDGLRRFRMRLVQVSATTITISATAWVCTLGAIPAILGLMVAKHVLVAIIVMGLGVDAPRGGRP
jgi:hypothetical protein